MLSVQDLWHLTPLHHAVAFERPATVELLMKHSTPQSRDLFRNPTPETQVTVWTLANGNEVCGRQRGGPGMRVSPCSCTNGIGQPACGGPSSCFRFPYLARGGVGGG